MNFDKNILSFLERSTKALETLSKSKSKENILITKSNLKFWEKPKRVEFVLNESDSQQVP